jgi:isoquinoline 1-oxidoreductase subunit beta
MAQPAVISEKLSNGFSRRGVLTGGVASAFLLAFHVPVRGENEPVQPPDDTSGKFAPNAFIRIDPAGKTTLVMPQTEMGQGIYTAVAMILAEELDADFSAVVLEHAPANEKLYANPAFGVQATGGSTSVRAFWKPLRAAGATARAMLVQAAAKQWQVDTSRSDPCRKRTPAWLWRAGRCGRRRNAAKGRAGQGSQEFRADRQAAEAV